MAKKSQQPDSKLHWFWNLTTKWWFFPAFWFLLAVLFGVVFDTNDLFYYGLDISWMVFYIFGIFMRLGLGFTYLILILINLIMKLGFDMLSFLIILLTQAVFYVYFAVSIFKIVKSRKKYMILKKHIIILFLLVLLGFIGLVLTNIYSLDFGFGPPLFGR